MAWKDGRHPVQVWLTDEDYKTLKHQAVDECTTISKMLLSYAEKRAAKIRKAKE